MFFNGISKDFIRINRELFRPLTPPIEFTTQPIRSGGSRTLRKRFTDASLPVPIIIKSGSTIESLKQELSDWLVHNDAKELIFKDQPDFHYMAEYESMDLDEYYRYGKGILNFYLPIANRFGKEKTINVTKTTNNFTISGQLGSVWKSKTTFTGAASKYELTSSNGIIVINFSFESGDILEIDYYEREATLNGKNIDVAISLNTEWFELPKGNVDLKATTETEIFYNPVFY